MGLTTRLATEPFDPSDEFAKFHSMLEDEGATVSFVGIARPHSLSGQQITGLFLDHHPRLTAASLRQIGEDALSEFDVSAAYIVHRCGQIAPGESIVFVATASLHRRAAFEAADYAMDRLKTEAVFWKREDSIDGSRWIEPTSDDALDRARWSN